MPYPNWPANINSDIVTDHTVQGIIVSTGTKTFAKGPKLLGQSSV